MAKRIPRRGFLKLAASGVLLGGVHRAAGQAMSPATGAAAGAPAIAGGKTQGLFALQPDVTRHWIGPDFWGNRLQDWRLHDGRIECCSDEVGPDLRTVSILTRELNGAGKGGLIKARLGRVSPRGKGFGGFLLGAGGGKLDHRAAALVQRASGENGGILCVVNAEGVVGFREHTSEETPLRYGELPAKVEGAGSPTAGEIALELQITPAADGTFSLELIAAADGTEISRAKLDGVKSADVQGGLMLVSASTSGPDGARFWFKDIEVSGDSIPHRPERALGPILGTLYSLNGSVMKMTAQLMPVADTDPRDVTLEIRDTPAAPWREIARQPLAEGYCAGFRIADWDDSRDWQYRVTYATDGTAAARQAHYEGVVRKDPHHDRRQMSIGLYSCVTAAARGLDGGGPARRELPGARKLGRYTPDNIYFPYVELLQSARHHDPDMLAFCGDQFYETSPTVKVTDEAPLLDYLYKYYLWLWSFRDITRDRPTLVMVDDHDVYHGNLWGNGGRAAPDGNQDLGGYVRRASWVNMVQRTQCGHNPDPYDPTPVDQGITTYYCAFKYGGVDFCLLEDRKFKTAPVQGESLNMHVAELLGARQEKFIREWGEQVKGADARICLTATLFGTAQTSPEGLAVVDFDSNGYPPLARDQAVRLLREANVLILSGDQHLGSVIRLGDDTYTDGPIQFSGPAGSTSWTRWFEPAQPLPNAGATPHTGDFQDGYGNKMRVLAVANPSITFAEYRKHIKGRAQGIGDRNLKAEGYGIVKVNLDSREYELECWRWDTDPAAPGAKQYAGWPMKFGFDEVAKG